MRLVWKYKKGSEMKRCDCTQSRKLVQTGRSYPDADLICPVCGQLWWSCKGGITKVKPEKK